MKASVIIPNLNGAGWLRDSIESVWAQTEQDFELIVIDNGSTDESLDIARSYCGRDRYTLIENAGNTGFSHAVNQGIAIAKGEYMALFNNDAFAEPDWLAELIKTADADPKIFAVSSLMLRYYEPELADDAGDYVTILGFACKRGDGLKASRYTKPCRVFSACGGAALYRKSILDEIGVFDELFFAYYEDVDLSWRANNFGYRNVYCPTARCRHICGATTGAVRYNPFKSIQSGRNSILLPYKNQPILMLVLNFIPMLLGYLLKVLMFRLRGFGGDYAKGFRVAELNRANVENRDGRLDAADLKAQLNRIEAQLELQDQQNRGIIANQRKRMVLSVVLCVIILAALAFFSWRMNEAYVNVMDACNRVNDLADTVQTSLDTLDQAQLDSMMQDLPEITAQLKKIDVDALNKVLTELPALMDTVNSLQTQVQNISNWFSSLGSVFGR